MTVGDLASMPRPPGMPPEDSPEALEAALARASSEDMPKIEDAPNLDVTLPVGLITPEDVLVNNARVRELTGYDEEKLARIDISKNPATFTTDLLLLGVESIGSHTPSREMFQEMLVGDRDELLLGIRKATYGNLVLFKLACMQCEEENDLNVELDKDVKTKVPSDPRLRKFEIKLRRGVAEVGYLTGLGQEMASENVARKSQAELNTAVLARTVISINGQPTFGNPEASKSLSLADRNTLMDWVASNQPGPQLQDEIRIPCAACGSEFSILLGTLNLFRF